MTGSALIDLEVDSATEDEVRGRVPVTDTLKQPLGVVHGGVYAVIADALTAGDGRVITNQTSFLRPATEGTLHAVARRRHGGVARHTTMSSCGKRVTSSCPSSVIT